MATATLNSDDPTCDPIPPDPTDCSLSDCRNWNRTWDLFPRDIQPRDKYFFQLFHHVTRMIVEQLSLRHLAVFVAVATHANADGVCEPAPSSRTIGKLIGMRDSRTVSRYVRQLIALGLLERQRVGWRRWRITVVRTDGPRDYTQIDRRWLWRDLGANGIGLALLLAAVANGRSSFVTERKVLVKMSGLSRNTFDALISEIANYSLVETRRAPGNMVAFDLSFMQWTFPKKSRSSLQKEPDFSQKIAGEEDNTKSKTLEDKSKTKSKTRVEHDQRRAKNRADAAATIPTFSPSEDQTQSAVCSERAAPAPTALSQVDHRTHIEGFVEYLDQRGNRRLRECPECRAAMAAKQAHQQADEETARQREFAAAQRTRPLFDFSAFNFGDMFTSRPARPSAPVVEVQWSESKPPAPARQRIAGDVLPPKMYADCWKWIAVHTNLYREGWDEETRKRVDGMLQKGGVARFGAEEFRKAIVDVLAEQWERKHAHCHDHCTCGCDPCQCQDGLCDGTCGHDEDECNGMPQCIHEPKRLLDLVGHALQWLRQDEKFGRDFNNGCPNPVYQQMYAA
jgi:hypothetical protein